MMLNHPTPDNRAAGGEYGRMIQAWQWLCEQRRQAPDHADVWDIRWQYLNTGEGWLTALTERVLRGEYRLTPLQLHGRHEDRKAVWSAQDALVLKWTALSLQHLLPLHPSCEHVKGHGGGKLSVDRLHGLLAAQHEKKTDTRGYTWVCRTDIRGYYRNINKQTLLSQVQQQVQNPELRDLVHQYIHYTVEDGGTFHAPEKGISRGCSLSPLMGALHLCDMDEHFSQQPNIHYARYMDDVIILARTRWSLRKHTKRLMQWFGEYGFEAHPDKTQIGRTEKGFDWMGAWLTSDGVMDIAPRAKANHREKVRRLYEQLARLPKWKRKRAAPLVHARVSTYRKRWTIWVGGILVSALSQQAVADRPIIILSAVIPAGVVLPGGDFHSTVRTSLDPTTRLGSGKSLINLTYLETGSNLFTPIQGGGLGWGERVAGGVYNNKFGVRILSRGAVYLVGVSGTLAASDDLGNKWLAELDPDYATLCNPTVTTTGPGTSRINSVKVDNASICRIMGNYPSGQPLALDATVNWRPVTGTGAVTAGSTDITGLYIGDYGHNRVLTLDKPTAIVVAGLTCTLNSPPPIDLGSVASSSTHGQMVASATGLSTGLTASCQGANTSTYNIPISYTLKPWRGGIAEAKAKLTYTDQPSFYMVFTNDGSATCDPTSPHAITLDGYTATSIATVTPGQSMTATNVPLGASLCTTGDTTQPPGRYEMSVTATLVSY